MYARDFRVVCSFASSVLCGRFHGLSTLQRQLCAESPDAFGALGEGHKLGEMECLFQFKGIRVVSVGVVDCV